MMDGHDQMAYDRGTSIFSPDGRLYQVEYAREAVKRGSTIAGVRATDGVALVVDKRIGSTLVEGDSIEKLHVVDDHLAAASAGHVADARRLVDALRRDAQFERVRYGEAIPVGTAIRHVSDLIQAYTQVGGARPFGAALLVAGVDPDGTPLLYETDPSGAVHGWQAVAVGADRDDVQSFLEANYEADADLEDAVLLGLRALAAASEDSLDADGVAVATVDTDRVRILTEAEITAFLEDVDAITEDDPAGEVGEADGERGDEQSDVETGESSDSDVETGESSDPDATDGDDVDSGTE